MRHLWRSWVRWDARRAILGGLALIMLLLLVGGAVAAGSLLTDSLYRVAEQAAARDARLITDLGLDASLARRGQETPAELSLARREFATSQKTLPLLRVVVRSAAGVPVFWLGDWRPAKAPPVPGELWHQIAMGNRTETRSGSDPGVGPVVEAAVPMSVRGQRLVAGYEFSRRGLDGYLSAAKRRLYVMIGVAALLLYLAVLPVIARAIRMLPSPIDPRRRRELDRFQRALVQRELRVHYQPKVEIATGEVSGVEALVRWEHPDRGLLGPAEFLPLAGSSPPLLVALTAQVLDIAVSDCARWRTDGLQLSVAVNVAASVLLEETLVRTVREALEAHTLPPHLLTLEITESALMERGDCVRDVLTKLRGLGVAVSIDDFGTGHSSLARLQSLPLDELKVDRSFIADLLHNERALAIGRLIIDLAKSLELDTVAEGVEDEQTVRLLDTLGCTRAQGFHFARPLPENQLLNWLEVRRAHARVTS